MEPSAAGYSMVYCKSLVSPLICLRKSVAFCLSVCVQIRRPRSVGSIWAARWRYLGLAVQSR